MLVNKTELYKCMDKRNLSFIIGASYQNVYYLTDFFSPNPFLLSSHITLAVFPRDESKKPILIISKSEVELLTTHAGWTDDFRCYGDAYINDTGSEPLNEADAKLREVIKTLPFPSPAAAVADALEALGRKPGDKVGIDEMGTNVKVIGALTEAIGPMEYATDVISEARLIKTPEEVARLKKAVEITEQSIRSCLEQAWIGMSESDLAKIYVAEVCKRGGLPFFNIIGFGSHGAHANALLRDDIRLERNMPIRFDIGCTYKNYTADTARNAVFGELSKRENLIYDTLCDANALGISKIKPGVKASEVFHTIMNHIHKVLPEYRRSHVGHGIGVEIYDPPVIGNMDWEFREGMVMCVEVPYYEVGLGGYQVEELIHVTADGVEVLTERPVHIMKY